MGFDFPESKTNQATTQPVAGAQSRRTSNQEPKTRIAYVNMYLPTADGTRVKLVSDLTLGLYLEKAAEKQLVDLIKQGVITEEQAGQLIQVEINLTRDESKPLVLDLSKIGVANPLAGTPVDAE
jgi:uncharacterized protein YkwD